MSVLQHLQRSIMPGEVLEVVVGFSRVAVLVRTERGLSCGLAATLLNSEYHHRCQPVVRNSGSLHKLSTVELAAMVESESLTEAAIGMAAINALLPVDPGSMVEMNAEEYIVDNCQDKDVAFIVHFPFGEKIHKKARNYWIFEMNPKEGDLPASSAPDYLPKADIVAITATTLINKTFDEITALCKPGAEVIMLGPSTPMTPELYAYGLTILSGIQVLNPFETILDISQGGSSHMLNKKGYIRYVTMRKNLGSKV